MSRVLWDVYLTVSTPNAVALAASGTAHRDSLPASATRPQRRSPDAVEAPHSPAGSLLLTLSYDSLIVSYDRL